MTDRDPFTQLTGTFDLPVTPSPDFTARLRGQVVAEIARIERGGTIGRSVSPVSGATEEAALQNDTLRASRSNGTMRRNHIGQPIQVIVPLPTRPPRRTSRLLRWLPALEMAAALLLVMTLFGQLIGPQTIRNALIPGAFQPTQTNTPDEVTMWGANPGRTWEFAGSKAIPAPSDAEVLPATEGVKHVAGGVVSGDTLVRMVPVSEGLAPTFHLEAISLSNKARLWIMPLVVFCVPATADGRVFVVNAEFGRDDTETYVLALELATGSELWRTPIAGPRATSWTSIPLAVGSTVVVTNDVGTVYALDTANGAKRWQIPEAVDDAQAPGGQSLIQEVGSTAADGQHVYVTTAAGELLALDLQTGEVAWRVSLVSQYGNWFLSAGVMTDGSSVILDLVSADQSAPPSGGTLVTNSTIVALDARNGQQRWVRRGIPPFSVRALADGVVIAALLDEQKSDGSGWIAAILAKDGTEVWRTSELPVQSPNLSIIDGQILAVDPRGSLVALNLTDGHVAWATALPVLAAGPPIPSQGRLVVLDAQGEIALFAIEEATDSEPLLSGTPPVTTPAA